MPDLRFVYNGLVVSFSMEQLLGENCDYQYNVFYQKNSSSELNALCDKYGSDKGEIVSTGHPYPWPSHNYADFYEGLFGHCRASIRRVFECGLGTNNPVLPSSMGPRGRPGASLRVWRDYFVNADVYGADIDQAILFQEPRISTFHMDQTSPESIRYLWEQIGPGLFDLMIDDGLHTFDAGRCLFEHAFHKVRKGGIYIIEDVAPSTMMEFRSYFVAKQHKVEYVRLRTPSRPGGDNALIVIRN